MTPRISLRFLFPVALVASAFAAESQPNVAFDKWVDAFTTEWVRTRGTTAGGGENAERAPSPDENPNDAIPSDGQAERQKKLIALAERGLKELDQWPAASLAGERKVSAGVLRWQLETFIAREPFTEYPFVFRQLRGLHVALVDQLTERAPLRTAANVQTYLTRLERVPKQLDEGIARAKAAVAKGLIPPKFILERARQQLVMFLEPEAGQNIFVESLARKSADIANFPAVDRTAAVAKATKLVTEQVRPAYARVLAFLDEVLPKSTDEAGISRLPNGAAAYAAALAGFTSTKLTADEIHALGLREVARVQKDMDALLREMGFTEGTFNERYSKATAVPALPADPDPRVLLLARYTENIRDAEKRSEKLFNLKPRAPVEVRRVPPLAEASASAYYTMPARDGSRPGVFWIPLRGPVLSLNSGMRSVSYHEGVPGHHFQLAIQQELTGLPRFRAQRTFGGISAHSEGWGLYAERLAVEQGWYEGDNFGKLGALQAELFRARRLVVDTGLHAKGWTRQQAIDYGISVSEVERYVVNPGQACSYMIGMLRILELREKARAALGERFSLPAFHDVVLKAGAVPLDVLSEVVNDWIAAKKA